MGIFEKFKLGFKKSANKISEGFREIVVKKEIDDKKLDEIEEFLMSSDVGVEASAKIKTIISDRKIDPNLDPINEINKILKEFIINLSDFFFGEKGTTFFLSCFKHSSKTFLNFALFLLIKKSTYSGIIEIWFVNFRVLL